MPIAEMAASIKKDIVWRIAVVYVFVLLAALLVIGRVLYLQFGERKKWTDLARKYTTKDVTIEPERGDIYDENYRLLATSVPYYNIRMDTRAEGLDEQTFKNSVDSLALCLSRLFKDRSAGMYKAELLKAWRSEDRSFLVKRKVGYDELKKVKTFPIFKRGPNKGGLVIEQDNRRFPPNEDLALRTIGYLSKDEKGNKVGIEGAYDDYLRGVKGVRLAQKVAGNFWIPVHDGNEVEPKNGKDVVSTINVELQDVAENALRNQLILNNADHGCAILMEVETGDIKAIANLGRDENGLYKEDFNYAIGEATEPGSTFKLVSMLAALEDGFIDITDTVDTGNGIVRYYNQPVTDHEGHGLGKISVKDVFANSSNVGTSKIIVKNYRKKERLFVDHINKLGLNKPLGLDLNGEATPYMGYPGAKSWSGVSLPMMSIGYEVKVYPLQTLTLYNAIANNGKMVKPRFVKEISYHGESEKEFDNQVLNRSICSNSTLKKLREMLEAVVEYGTAKNLGSTIYKIAGKTGTAQIANLNKGYRSGARMSYQASFVGYFPADKPKYSCIVVVSAPSNSVYYGNLVAGPVFKEIADKVYAISLDMHQEVNHSDAVKIRQAPSSKCGSIDDLENVLDKLDFTYVKTNLKSPWANTKVDSGTVVLSNRYVARNLVPNVIEMGAKDAVFLLENAGLQVTLRGRGKVKHQSIPPGTRIKPGSKIIIEMSYL